MKSGGTRLSWAKPTKLRSARRQTVRARWRAAALGGRAGQHERAKRRQLRVGRVDRLLHDPHPLGAQLGLGQSGPDFLRVRRGEVAADGEEVALDRFEQRVEDASGRAARAAPMSELSSSTSPYAATRGWSFGTRPPPKSPVSPLSPVLV